MDIRVPSIGRTLQPFTANIFFVCLEFFILLENFSLIYVLIQHIVKLSWCSHLFICTQYLNIIFSNTWVYQRHQFVSSCWVTVNVLHCFFFSNKYRVIVKQSNINHSRLQIRDIKTNRQRPSSEQIIPMLLRYNSVHKMSDLFLTGIRYLSAKCLGSSDWLWSS